MTAEFLNRLTYGLLVKREGEKNYELINIDEMPNGQVTICLIPAREETKDGE